MHLGCIYIHLKKVHSHVIVLKYFPTVHDVAEKNEDGNWDVLTVLMQDKFRKMLG